MKKVLSLFLSVLMLTSVVAAVDLSVYAATSGTCGDNLTYTLDDEGTLTISGTGDMYDYTSASSAPWHSDRNSIEIVIINSGVTSIGNDAFSSCTSLTSITIPNGVTSIGDSAFAYCRSLTSVTIPDSVTSISEDAFYGCTSLTSITIPNSVTSIGVVAFAHCPSLTSIMVESNNAYYSSEDGVLYNKDKTELICCPGGKTGAYTISNSVTSIGESAFYYCESLTSITIPNGVTSIGDDAFMNCRSLTSVTIPDSVTSIGEGAFDECISLTSVTIGNSVMSIGDYTFAFCYSLTSVTIGNSVTSIGNWAFEQCNITNITIPDSVTSIGDAAFQYCESLTSITIPNGVTSIGYNTFFCCFSLTSITIPNSVTNIGDSAFWNCGNLTDVYYGGSKSDWNNIDIGNYNDYLKNATIHYNATTSTTCKTHTWDSGKTTTKATCAKTGVKTYTCTVCGATKTEKIAKKAHTWKVSTKASATNKKNGKFKCSVCGATKTIYYPKTVKLSTTSYTYNGKAKKPSVTVKDSKGNKISSKYYTASYISQSTGKKVSSMKNPGKYYVKVTFKTRYSGSIKKTVTIKPKKTSIKSIKASKKGFTVKWGKVSTQNTGYQIQYSTSKSFKSPKTVTVKKTGTTSKKVTKLKAKKKYYVRVRTYKTVKINGKNTKIYSAWSSTKGVTTKK